MDFFAILGNYGLSLELGGILKMTDILTNNGAPVRLWRCLERCPSADCYILVCDSGIHLAGTSYDSASYVLASIATKELEEGKTCAMA